MLSHRVWCTLFRVVVCATQTRKQVYCCLILVNVTIFAVSYKNSIHAYTHTGNKIYCCFVFVNMAAAADNSVLLLMMYSAGIML